MDVMEGGKTRVDFNAPESLVERADIIADLLGTSRTSLLIDALRDELQDIVEDEAFQGRLEDAYYNGQIDLEAVRAILGTEEAMRMKLLRESLKREPPVPDIERSSLPTQEEFYDGDIPEWTPDEERDEEEPDPLP